jgi:hypothetical protein
MQAAVERRCQSGKQQASRQAGGKQASRQGQQGMGSKQKQAQDEQDSE